jgi:hypothetical protein
MEVLFAIEKARPCDLDGRCFASVVEEGSCSCVCFVGGTRIVVEVGLDVYSHAAGDCYPTTLHLICLNKQATRFLSSKVPWPLF